LGGNTHLHLSNATASRIASVRQSGAGRLFAAGDQAAMDTRETEQSRLNRFHAAGTAEVSCLPSPGAVDRALGYGAAG
jgi:hypothetical protein